MLTPTHSHAILAAALLLPGIGAVHAANAPEKAAISVRFLGYQESQPDLERIRIRSPSLALVTPLAGAWSLAASLTADDVSGASPRYHSAVSGASRMSDERTAGDAALTRYFADGSVTMGAAYSTEHDYESRALSLNGTLDSADKNTSWSFGIGATDDAINPVNRLVVGAGRQSVNLLVGVTRVLTPNDLAQLTLTHGRGHGYYGDPYKALDQRPDRRNQSTLLLHWNHHFAGSGTSRLNYRYYSDSYGIRAHTLGAEFAQPLGQHWTLTPSLRLYTQRAATFYYDPQYDSQLGEPFPPGFVFGQLASADQRLSGFGAVTLGVKLTRQLGPDWKVDLKLETYEQRGAWRAFGSGSPGLAPLHARSFQVGATRQW
jgi:hypothetical protein